MGVYILAPKHPSLDHTNATLGLLSFLIIGVEGNIE